MTETLTTNQKKQKVYFRKTSLVDYPEKVAAAIFFPFCNLRCPWCHNGSLIDGADSDELISLEAALAHIKKRASVLDGVVLSGGEPAFFPGLLALIAELKAMQLAVKLDTNGTRPDVLSALLAAAALPDYIAMDLKLAPERYASLLPRQEKHTGLAEQITESAAMLCKAHKTGRITVEFRSLVLPEDKFTEADALAIAAITDPAPWYIRAFRPGNCLDPAWNAYPETPPAELERFAAFNRNQA